MRFDWVAARAFGPLVNGKLEFAPGLNIICGPNEAGKSGWHGALFAALCGRRRGPGRAADDRRFAERHRPWSGSEWRVSTRLTLARGREIELYHDLEGGVDCRAIEHPTGRDVSGEIMNEGSPDGSVWLGLDRRSFLTVACVRQAEILRIRDREEAESLQAHLQRAAASVSAKATAAEASKRLEDFQKEYVGSERAPTKPLVSTTRRRQAADIELRAAEQAHSEYLDIQEDADDEERAAASAEDAVTLLEASVACHQAEELESRLGTATALARLFPSGEPRDLVDDADIANRLTSALRDWDQRPNELPLLGPNAAELEAQLGQLPLLPDGDTDEHDDIRQLADAYTLAHRQLSEHATTRPNERPAPETGGLDTQTLRDLARGVELGAIRPSDSPQTIGPLLLTGLAFVLVGIVLLLAGPKPVAAITMLAGACMVAWALFQRRSVSSPASGPPDARLLQRLATAGVPADPAALREIADRRDQASIAATAIAVWAAREQELSAQADRTRHELMSGLASGGFTILGSETTDATYTRYRQECRQRRQRLDLLAELRARQAAEEQNSRHKAAEAYVRTAAESAGLESAVSAEVLVQQLQARQDRRGERLAELDGARREWTDFQTALGGLSLDDLEEQTSRARLAADALSTRFESAQILTVPLDRDINSQLTELRRQATETREKLARTRQRLQDHAKRMPDVAMAKEESELAQAELDRLRSLDGILRQTQMFLTQATQRAHLLIAPVLQSTLQQWLPIVTCGRYVGALVDPETLEIKIRSDGGTWRAADQLSHGTSEQVYLLLRVALAENLASANEPSPLILDDVTAQSDPERTAAILQTLALLSADRQIIFFSQEAEVLDWARRHEGTTRLIELPILEPAR